MTPRLSLLVFLWILLLQGCVRPYLCGPVLKKDDTNVFKKINDYLGLEPGTVFADVGASSGYYDGAMSVHTDSVHFYIQDIDAHCLTERNLGRVVRHYSRMRDTQQTNTFSLVVGEETRTNLPDSTFDVIYSNATFHVLSNPVELMTDLSQKLKPEGYLFIRDAFASPTETMCEECKVPLVTEEEFLRTMTTSGYVLVEKSPPMDPYPIYKFKVNTQPD